MSKFGISQSVKRKEDDRFLKGTGNYVDDNTPDGALFAYFLRSPMAHAEITVLDVADAREAEGVALVLIADDLGNACLNNLSGALIENKDGTMGKDPQRPFLANGRVRFVGEAIACIVAETLEQARDAAELIELDLEELSPHISPTQGGAQVHEIAPENLAYDWAHGDAAKTATVFAKAAHHITMEVDDNRIICASMEPRVCFAEWNDDRLHVCVSAQGVWGIKDEMVKLMKLDPSQVRVTNPDVGGGFGMKGFNYPEYFGVAQAARVLGRPVRWTGDRTESNVSDNSGRAVVTLAEMAFDADYKLLAYRCNAVSDLGAYNSGYAQFIQSDLALKVFTGCYDVQDIYFSVQGIYTNTTPVDAYRGAGRPEAIYVIERIMDTAARQMGIDPMVLRRKNFIGVEQMPYLAPTGEKYDVGDFNRVLDRALIEADIDGFAGRKTASMTNGKLRGLGLCYYIESILGAPNETTKIEFTDDGGVSLYVGTQSNGQGHETVFAQILHERTGIPFDQINFVQGDSDRIPVGGGTGGSRSVTMQGNSINAASDHMISRFKPLVAAELDVTEDEIGFEDGNFHAEGTNKFLSIMDAAALAQVKNETELLVTELENIVPERSYPNGAHFCEVEIDPQTGHTSVVKYTVVDDFGKLMNPMLAEGQVHGGVVQGIGQAISEHVVYDEDGQLLSGTFMDYGMPRAADVPMMPFHVELTPSTANEIGMKGCGEAGTVGALAAVGNAVLDALWDQGVHRADMPFTPIRVWNMLNAAKIAAE